jgi:hypothetical protein
MRGNFVELQSKIDGNPSKRTLNIVPLHGEELLIFLAEHPLFSFFSQLLLFIEAHILRQLSLVGGRCEWFCPFFFCSAIFFFYSSKTTSIAGSFVLFSKTSRCFSPFVQSAQPLGAEQHVGWFRSGEGY